MMAAYKAIPIGERGNDTAAPFVSKFVPKRRLILVQILVKFSEIMNDRR